MERPALTPQQQTAWRVAVGTWVVLLVFLAAWELWIAPIRPGGSWLVLKVVPLVLPLPAMLRGNKDAMQWALLIVLLYLIEATVRILEPAPYGLLAAIELLLVLVFFVAAIVYLRPFKRAARAMPRADSR